MFVQDSPYYIRNEVTVRCRKKMAVADGRLFFGILIYGTDFKMPKCFAVYYEVKYQCQQTYN